MRVSTSSTRPWGSRRPRSDHFCRAFLAFLALFLPGLAFGAEAEKVVELTLAGSPERLDRVEPSLADLLGRLPVTLRVTRAPTLRLESIVEPAVGAGPAFVRIWVDVGPSHRATLYFADAEWERILIRRFILGNELDEVEREEIAQVVRSAVEALLAGAKIGISRAEAKAELLPEAPPPVAPAPPPKPPEPAPTGEQSAWQLVPGAFYEAQLYRGSLWQGPGFFLGLEDGSVGTRATLQYRAPMQIDGDALGVRLQALSARALGTLTWQLGETSLDLGAGPGLDFTYVEPRRVADRGAPGDAVWDPVPVARLLCAASWALPSLELGLLGGLDADLVETRHVAERNGTQYTVFTAPRLRVFFGLGVTGRRSR